MASFDLAYLKKKKDELFVCALCVCLSACLPICLCMQCPQSQQKVSDPLELESEAVVSLLTWVLRTELRTSEKQQVLLTAELRL